MKTGTGRVRRLIVVCAVGVGLAFLVAVTTFCVFCAWPPDVWHKNDVLVGELQSPQGEIFQVTQTWNGVDFYSTVLRHRDTKGRETSFALDGDDMKRWSCSLKLDGAAQTLLVELGGQERGALHFKDNVFVRADGAQQNPLP